MRDVRAGGGFPFCPSFVVRYKATAATAVTAAAAGNVGCEEEEEEEEEGVCHRFLLLSHKCLAAQRRISVDTFAARAFFAVLRLFLVVLEFPCPSLTGGRWALGAAPVRHMLLLPRAVAEARMGDGDRKGVSWQLGS
ncbi:hypothetical protein PLESTM_000340400 [Pleodorina starrii]|nr:hypothetical protein PLESTM_000340400 [Pleodorina starrii]